jgi:hypothetical protein
MTYLEKKIAKGNESMDNVELLNWAMNQLYRAARTIDLITPGPGKALVASGCDVTATVILRKLVKSKRGYNLVKGTNRKLVRGYARP